MRERGPMASDPSTGRKTGRALAAVGICLFLSGCNSSQSALHPAGEQAAEVATLFWWMTAGLVVIWGVVMGCTIYAVLGRNRPKSERFAELFILGGGVAFPTVVLAALLIFGLSLLPAWGEDEPPNLRVLVSAEQYWWRIGYEQADGSIVESANELHLPAGATVEFVVDSPDVIHSFWIPALGGKIDAIPGRTNVLRLTPTKPGIYRGVCAEFCGASHALMAFVVEVHEAAAFDAVIAREAAPADADAALFTRAGCAGCHTIRGVSEQGSAGPDLTHFASRRSIAAGTLDNTPQNLRSWLVAPDRSKPGTHMPGYAMLDDAELDAIVSLLMELR
jgi:cytochrome c oxidase subunit 2